VLVSPELERNSTVCPHLEHTHLLQGVKKNSTCTQLEQVLVSRIMCLISHTAILHLSGSATFCCPPYSKPSCCGSIFAAWHTAVCYYLLSVQENEPLIFSACYCYLKSLILVHLLLPKVAHTGALEQCMLLLPKLAHTGALVSPELENLTQLQREPHLSLTLPASSPLSPRPQSAVI